MSSLIAFERAALGYGRRVVLEDISFEVNRGDYLGLVGPNGAGKTTVLKVLLGIHAALSGGVRRAPGLRFGYVPQREQLNYNFPLSVADVVLMGRPPHARWQRESRARDREAVDHALAQVGLTPLARRQIRFLSGGERQRMLIARALVSEPTVLVLDEPTNGMDLAATTQILALVRQLRRDQGITVLLVSHALNEVANEVDRIALVVGGRFRLGPTAEILTSDTLSAMYGIPVDVAHFGGRHVVFAKNGTPTLETIPDPRRNRERA
jgi:ABC-type Mn2+/Zn2+ transport system ATPase subunit